MPFLLFEKWLLSKSKILARVMRKSDHMARADLRAHPCAKNAQGWGTRCVSGASEFEILSRHGERSDPMTKGLDRADLHFRQLSSGGTLR
jgi:hypothetical protein